MRVLKRLLLNVIIVLNVVALISVKTNNVKAFMFNADINHINILIKLNGGTWGQSANPWDDEWNLNLWDDEQLKTSIPTGQIFSYNSLLFIKNPNTNYIPKYHGMPGEGGNAWAIFALELEWIPNTNYRNNSVVTREGKYYITNIMFNNNWFIDDPKHNRNEWLEIELISEEHFEYFPGTNLRDYAKPNFNYIVYK